jgi:hypothetical protein
MLPHSIGDSGERVYSAPDIASALDFVTRSLRQGRYQFFRGQENSNWLPCPSLARVPDESRDQVKDRLVHFIGYAREVSRVAGIQYSNDDIWAIAQHYGLPTNFLDLTTDPVVAAMFACPPDTAWGIENAAIHLYAQETIDVWCEVTRDLWHEGARRPEDPCLELLRIDVSNLWRLQAQRGLFLFNPFANFCEHFMPDRVVFPHPANGFVQQGYELYPKNKSLLEIQLDLFFDLESTEKTKKIMRAELPASFITPGYSDKLFGDTTPRFTAARAQLTEPWLEAEGQLHHELRSNASGISNLPLHTLPDTYFRPMWKFRRQELWPHESWFGKQALAWLTTPIEIFRPDLASAGDEIVLDLDEFRDALPCGPGAAVKVDASLERRTRDRDIRFSLRCTSLSASSDKETDATQTEFLRTVGLFADYLWAGLRRTPARTDLIVRCIHNLCACAALRLRSQGKWDECYGRRDMEHLKLEYAPLGGHSRTAKVLCADLAPAIRSDLADVVAMISPSGVPPQPAIAVHLQQMIYPQYLFDFDRFTEVFIARVLSYEAIIAAMMRRTPTGLAFNPRTVKIFGLS